MRDKAPHRRLTALTGSSLQTRLMLAVSLVALAAIGAVAIAARQSTRSEFKRFQDIEQRRSGDLSAGRLEQVTAILEGRCCDAASLRDAAALIDPADAVLVVALDGRLIASAGGGAAALPTLRTQMDGDVLRVEAVRVRDGVSQSIALQFRGPSPRIVTVSGQPAGVYVIPVPTADVAAPAAAFLGSLDRRLLAATMVIGALALAITWTIARRIISPICELARAAGDLGQGDFSRRVETRGSDEVGDLARSFNAMASELERQQMLRRSLVHDVAHELRTPLTALRCRLETLLDGVAADPREALTSANEEVRHLSRLIDDLDELAVAEAHDMRLSIGDTPIAEVAASALRAAGLEQNQRINLSISPGLSARADPLRVRQVLLNLLTNADRHTPRDGTITVSGKQVGNQVVVDVRNTGSTLDAAQRARVFDRFYRVDAARQRATGGTGLGLAIVKHLVEAQGGEVRVASDDDSVAISFDLPAAPKERTE